MDWCEEWSGGGMWRYNARREGSCTQGEGWSRKEGMPVTPAREKLCACGSRFSPSSPLTMTAARNSISSVRSSAKLSRLAASTDPARREDVDRFLRVGGIAYWTEMMGFSDGFAEGLEQAITAQLHPPPRRRV